MIAPGGTRVLARGGHAVLADVAHHQPATGPAPVEQLVERQLVAWFAGPGRIVGARPPVRGELLDEFHMPPRCGGELGGVVVAVAGPVESVGGELVPLFAGDFARLAADADRGVGVETGGRMRLRT